MRLASVSVDLDEIDCYAAIHGLPLPADDSAHAVYRHALPRFERLFDELGLRATFFAIGRDLDDAHAAGAIARLDRAGHEIANHSFDHRYDFSRRSPDEQRDDIARGSAAIERVTGSRPVGFRAPGYLVTDSVFDQLAALGVGYDSSVFACPGYYLAKSAALTAIALSGRRSHSIFGDPRVLTAPTDPYRVGRPYYRRGDGLLELPIGVTRGPSLRLPFIGTTLALAGERAAWLTRQIVGRPHVNLELHGIDLCDPHDDALAWLAPHQYDLKKRAAEKRAAFSASITVLREAGYELVTLREAAERLRTA
ncbi:MAG TPA: polysaccharide deacetylase family protein [Polyangiales bacterium]|nr:polysaccharide deacetylase family protein [Polyangiales bacterium]